MPSDHQALPFRPMFAGVTGALSMAPPSAAPIFSYYV
jgi:hypothetical protein